MLAIAYINTSRWCADCPRPHCGNAMQLQMGQSEFHCQGGCNLTTSLAWPPNAQQIWDELQRRPVATTRNWAPAGHWQALGQDRTQTAEDLRKEFDTFDPTSSLLVDLAGDYVDCVQLGPGLVNALESGQVKQIGGV